VAQIVRHKADNRKEHDQNDSQREQVLHHEVGPKRQCVALGFFLRGAAYFDTEVWLVIAVDWITGGIVDAKFFGVLAMFGAIVVMALAPWLDTSSVRSGKYRPMFKWWFALLVVDFFVLMWVGAMPAEGIYPYIALIASVYWFAYFLVILPLLGVIEKPLAQPATIEDDFNAHYGKSDDAAGTAPAATPAE
jgi:ubiquinol-cytochrome c reductase cytochrome b subunit